MDIPFPEPMCDLLAQCDAVVNGAKRAMYISPANGLKNISLPGGYTARRAEGALLTFNERLAQEFLETPVITDAHMARWLGYPEDKSTLGDDAVVVQARNKTGAVVMECATDNPAKTAKLFKKYGEHIVTMSIGDAIRRRMEIINGPL